MTDPVLFDRIGPPEFLDNLFGIKRRRPIPTSLDSLPDIDVIMISHAHYDHLDLPSLNWLIERQAKAPTIIVPRGVISLLKTIEAEIHELDWRSGQVNTHLHSIIQISAFRVEHYGYVEWPGRDVFTGFNGYLFGDNEATFLFIGDSAYQRFRDETGKMVYKFPQEVDWVLQSGVSGELESCFLPVGDHYYHWNHMGPRQASMLAHTLGCKHWLPIHYGTFLLTPPRHEPVQSERELERFFDRHPPAVPLECPTANEQSAFPAIGITCTIQTRSQNK